VYDDRVATTEFVVTNPGARVRMECSHAEANSILVQHGEVEGVLGVCGQGVEDCVLAHEVVVVQGLRRTDKVGGAVKHGITPMGLISCTRWCCVRSGIERRVY
jgi:hypothetical protein